MSDDIDTSATEGEKKPDNVVATDRDRIDAFVRTSLLSGHPPGKIAFALERQRSGLGRACLASIQALVLQEATGRRSGGPNSARLPGPEDPEMRHASLADLTPSSRTAGLPKLPKLLPRPPDVPQPRSAVDGMGRYGLPMVNIGLAAPNKTTVGLLRWPSPPFEPVPQTCFKEAAIDPCISNIEGSQ